MTRSYGAIKQSAGKELPRHEQEQSDGDERDPLLSGVGPGTTHGRRASAPKHGVHRCSGCDSSVHRHEDDGGGEEDYEEGSMRSDSASEHLLYGERDVEEYAIEALLGSERRGSTATTAVSVADRDEVQAGVRKMEAISRTWTQRTLTIAYLGIFLLSLSTSLESQTTASLTAYATSSFSTHSAISLVLVIQNVVNAVIKPPMAKIADVFGRLEAFTLSIAFYVLGYAQMAASRSIATYAAAQIFYSVGATGLQILNQVFIADSSGLLNRAMLSKIPDLPFLMTVWVGPSIAQWVLQKGTGDGKDDVDVGENWRLGYAMWIAILPSAFMPLAGTLVYNARKAKQLNLLRESTTSDRRGSHSGWSVASFMHATDSKSHCTAMRSIARAVRYAWIELDIGGLLLLSGGVALILVPLTMVGKGYSGGGTSTSTGYLAGSMVLGVLCLAAFPVWETSKRCAPRPLLSLRLLRQRSAVVGCAMAFLYFMAFYFSVQPYMYSYLQVVQNLPVATAGRTTQTFSFVSTISALAVSMLIRHSGRCRPFLVAGVCTYTLGMALMWLNRGAGSPLWRIVAVQVVVGAGGGMTTVPLQLGVQAAAASARRDVGAATAVFLTALEMGGAAGGAASGAIWARVVPGKLRRYLPQRLRGEVEAIYGDLGTALGYPVGSEARTAIARAYEETMGRLLVMAVMVCLPLVPLALSMTDYRLDRMDRMEWEEDGEESGCRHRVRRASGEI